MTRKHVCFVSTALQSVGRWRRRRSISTIIHSRIQPAAPCFSGDVTDYVCALHF